jgi:hypothetical protein
MKDGVRIASFKNEFERWLCLVALQEHYKGLKNSSTLKPIKVTKEEEHWRN